MVVITPANLLDLDRLSELETQLFMSEQISTRQFRYLLTKANSIVVIAEHKDQLLGYMVLLKRKTSQRLRIYSIGVHRAARKNGIAKRLISYAEQQARDHHLSKITLEVSIKNHPAIQFYLSSGFSLHGEKLEYYEDGCTALLFQKKIPEQEKTT